MADDETAWAAALHLSPEQASAFARLAISMDSNATELLRLMVDSVIDLDARIQTHGLGGIAAWVGKPDANRAAASHGLGSLPLDIRPSCFM
jgi:hypothetical protein